GAHANRRVRRAPVEAALPPQRRAARRQPAQSRRQRFASLGRGAPIAPPPFSALGSDQAGPAILCCDASARPTGAETLAEQWRERVTVPERRARQCRAIRRLWSDRPNADLRAPAPPAARARLLSARRSQPLVAVGAILEALEQARVPAATGCRGAARAGGHFRPGRA